jgi:acyl-CoA thioesterase
MEAEALARACAEKMWATDTASRELGMALEHVGAGHAVLTMPVTERMLNGHRVCHGGYIFALADSTFAFACNAYNMLCLAQHCSVTYLRPAHLGEVLRAEARERAREGRGGIYDVRVTGGDGRVIAEFRGHSRTTGQKFFPDLPEAAP